jgi:hypothetical protein
VNLTRKPPQALLYIQPKMTKFEVKEYLSKIYNVKVLQVNTANFLGKSIIEKPPLQNPLITSAFFLYLLKICFLFNLFDKGIQFNVIVLFFTFFDSLLCFIFVQANGKDFMEKIG